MSEKLPPLRLDRHSHWDDTAEVLRLLTQHVIALQQRVTELEARTSLQRLLDETPEGV